MGYEQAISFFESLPNPPKWDLVTTKKILSLSKTPYKKLSAIHVTGTNGKGSVAAMLESVLRSAGYRTGLYTSPHLADFRERIRLDGKKISRKKFVSLYRELAPLIKKMHKKPSFFEATTALAIKFFCDEKPDFVIAEVGMGGRLDATNVLRGGIAVVTNVALEHTRELGSSEEKIAGEKAGVIKPDAIVVTACEGGALRVIEKTCSHKKAHLTKIKKSDLKKIFCSDKKTSFEFKGKRYATNLLGLHQAVNASIAIEVVNALRSQGFSIRENAVRKGLTRVFWPARFQIVSRKPLAILDGAHNPHGTKALIDSVKAVFGNKKIFLVFGVLADKDYREIIRLLAGLKPALVVATQPKSERALDAGISAKEFARLGKKVFIKKKAADAVRFAGKACGKNGLVLVTGSLYLAGEALKAFKQPRAK